MKYCNKLQFEAPWIADEDHRLHPGKGGSHPYFEVSEKVSKNPIREIASLDDSEDLGIVML
jgi:hypothetical protein